MTPRVQTYAPTLSPGKRGTHTGSVQSSYNPDGDVPSSGGLEGGGLSARII